MASVSNCDFEIARIIVFDLRNSTSKDSRFITAAQTLYETVVLATSQNRSPSFSHITLIVMASKGFEYLLDVQPITSVRKTLKKAFGRLKQLLCYFNKENIFSKRGSFNWILSETLSKHRQSTTIEKTTKLEICILVLREEQFDLNDAETFLYQHDATCLQRLAVVRLLTTNTDDQIYDWEETGHKKLLARTLLGNEKETLRFFKDWLKEKSHFWTLVMAECTMWKVTVDLEQVLINFNCKLSIANGDGNPRKETIAFINREAEYVRCFEIFRWIRADGVPMTLLFGSPRRVVPSEIVDCTSSPEENRSQFVSLWQWLTREKLVALVRLVPHDKITEFFVLTPGDDRSLLLRNIAPRELILPLSNPLDDLTIDVEEGTNGSSKQVQCDNVHLACIQVPHLLEYQADQHECGIIAALEKELQEYVYATPTIPPLQMKNPSRRK